MGMSRFVSLFHALAEQQCLCHDSDIPAVRDLTCSETSEASERN